MRNVNDEELHAATEEDLSFPEEWTELLTEEEYKEEQRIKFQRRKDIKSL